MNGWSAFFKIKYSLWTNCELVNMHDSPLICFLRNISLKKKAKVGLLKLTNKTSVSVPEQSVHMLPTGMILFHVKNFLSDFEENHKCDYGQFTTDWNSLWVVVSLTMKQFPTNGCYLVKRKKSWKRQLKNLRIYQKTPMIPGKHTN